METLAIIGASYLQKPLVEKAKEMGLRVLCFAWEEGSVCKDVADRFYPISIVDKEEILTICQRECIDGICTIASDVAAPTVAYVAEQMGLIGNSYESSLRANNKYEMREAFSHAGIPCPRYAILSDVRQLENITFPFPVIVKPVDRSGSLGVSLAETPESLIVAAQTAINYSFAKKCIVEQYIKGREISVEFISYQGKHYPLQITDKVTTGAPHFVELEHHQPAELSLSQYADIYTITERALDVLGVTNGASHSEYKITDEGKYVVIEIGARMGGDFIGSDLVQLSTGYDFLKGVIDVALGRFEQPIINKKGYADIYFLCEQTKHLLDIDSSNLGEHIIKKYFNKENLLKPTSSSERSGYVIFSNTKKVIL